MLFLIEDNSGTAIDEDAVYKILTWNRSTCSSGGVPCATVTCACDRALKSGGAWDRVTFSVGSCGSDFAGRTVGNTNIGCAVSATRRCKIGKCIPRSGSGMRCTVCTVAVCSIRTGWCENRGALDYLCSLIET